MQNTGVRDVRRALTADDTVRDLAAGYYAGAGMVVDVLSGGRSAAQLRTAPHSHLLPGLAELPALLEIGTPGLPS